MLRVILFAAISPLIIIAKIAEFIVTELLSSPLTRERQKNNPNRIYQDEATEAYRQLRDRSKIYEDQIEELEEHLRQERERNKRLRPLR